MPYTIQATKDTPALVIYLLDVSGSMKADLGGKSRLDNVQRSLVAVITKMVQRSTKGALVSPRYHLAMIAYSDRPIDLLGGIKPIDQVAKMGVPRLELLGETNTEAAFLEAEKILRTNLPRYQNCPAPLVCHMTDGEFNVGYSPLPIADRIRAMQVAEGNVLVENIFLTASAPRISNINEWSGISSDAGLDSYTQTLFQMSSPVPESYRSLISEFGYPLVAGARFLFPGNQPELVELGFVVSTITGVRAA